MGKKAKAGKSISTGGLSKSREESKEVQIDSQDTSESSVTAPLTVNIYSYFKPYLIPLFYGFTKSTMLSR
jgi:hypothetical protein